MTNFTMLNNKKALWAGRWIATSLVCAIMIALVTASLTGPAVASSRPLTPAEQRLVGTWTFHPSESGAVRNITFHEDRTYTYDTDSSTDKARWRIDGANLVIEQKVKTIIGKLPFPIPEAVCNFQLPRFMAHTDKITQSVSFSPDGKLCISGVWPACSLTRSDTKAATDMGAGQDVATEHAGIANPADQ